MQRPRAFVSSIAALALIISLVRLAAQPPEPKDRIVEALRQFLQAIAGQYGDEGSSVGAAIDAMGMAIADWDRAVEADETAAASQPRTADLHGALGLVYLDRRRLDEALREFTTASRLDSKRADLHTFRGFALSLADQPAAVTEAFAAAAALDPDDPTTSYRLAQHLAKNGQPDQAAKARQQFRTAQQKRLAQSRRGTMPSRFISVDLIRQAGNVAPIFPPALYADGFVALKQGRYLDAVTRFREAAAVDPLTASGGAIERTRQGAAELRQGRLPEALEHLALSAQSAPDTSEAHRVLGMAYWADERLDAAIEQFRAAIRLRSDDERAQVALADVLVAAGKLSEAEQVLKDTIRTVPLSGHARYNLGRLYDLQQKWPDAAQLFEAAADLKPVVGLDYLYQTIARSYLSLPDFDAAIAAATKRTDVNPNNAEAHRVLGDLYLQQGRDEEALTELLAALLINPQSAQSYGGIAQAHLRAGRYPDAEEASRRALEIDPAHTPSRFALAMTLIRSSRADEGAKELERYRQLKEEVEQREQGELGMKMMATG